MANVTVSNSAQLVAALSSAVGGDVIKLVKSGGPYRVTSGTYAPTSEVFVESANYADPSTVEFLGPVTGATPLAGWKNLTFRRLIFDRSTISYATLAQYFSNVWLSGAENVKFLNNTMIGRAIAWYPGNTNPNNVQEGDICFRLVSAKNCTIASNEASGFSFWVQCTGSGQIGNSVTDNVVRKNQADYMQFVGGGSSILVARNMLLESLGSINNYQTDSGNHDDFIQFATTGSSTGWQDIIVEDNVLDTRGGDGYQGVFLGNESQVAYLNPIVRRNRIMTNQANGIAIDLGTNILFQENTLIYDASRTQTDPEVPFAKPAINIKGSATTGTVSYNLAPLVTVSAPVPAAGNITYTSNIELNYDNPFGTYAIERVFPGSLATDKSFQIVNAKLPGSFPAGTPAMKDATVSLPAIRNPNTVYDLAGADLSPDPVFSNTSNFVKSNVTITGGAAQETHPQGFWGFSPNSGIVGPRTILVEVFVDDPAAGEFLISGFNVLPTPATLTNQATTDRVYQSARKKGSGWHVESLAVPAGQTWWPVIQGVGGLNSSFRFSQFHYYDIGDLAVVWGDAVADVRARRLSGQIIPNSVAAPADGSAQSAYNGILGSSNAADGGDPAFVGATSTSPAMLVGDGGDSIQFEPTVFLRTLSLDKNWSAFMLFKAPSSWPGVCFPFGCGGANGTQAGLQVRYSGTAATYTLATSNGTTGGNTPFSSPSLPISGYVLLVISYNATTKATKIRVNNTLPVVDGVATGAKQATADATRRGILFSAFPSGAGFVRGGFAARVISDGEFNALKTQILSQEPITLP